MSNCPQGFETPYVLGREGCDTCEIRECLIPAVNNEIGEWYTEWLGSLDGWKEAFRTDIDEVKKDKMNELGKLLDEAFKQTPKKYGARIVKDAQERTGIGQTMLYLAHEYYLSDMYKTQKSLSWSQVKKKLEGKPITSQECKHEWESVMICKQCGKRK